MDQREAIQVQLLEAQLPEIPVPDKGHPVPTLQVPHERVAMGLDQVQGLQAISLVHGQVLEVAAVEVLVREDQVVQEVPETKHHEK